MRLPNGGIFILYLIVVMWTINCISPSILKFSQSLQAKITWYQNGDLQAVKDAYKGEYGNV